MRLVSFASAPSDRLGIQLGDRVVVPTDLDATAPGTMAALLEGGSGALDLLRRLVNRPPGAGRPVPGQAWEGRSVSETPLLAPVPRPGKVVAIGRNYPEHAAEDHVARPPAPVIFGKWPSCVIGPGAEVRWDRALTSGVDFEAELAVVIGTRARRVAPEDALDYVLGYTCLNDVTARDVQFGDAQWARGKSLDTFCPMGPALVTLDELPDAEDLAIECHVNGERMQSARTSEMFFGVRELISYCSQSFTLEPGDVIATGTPSGPGHFRNPPRYLDDGDVVTVEIEAVGELVNRCRVESVQREAVGAGR